MPSERETESTITEVNYFSTVEEHFRAARGTPLVILSPLDWALIESWKSAGIPLEAVLRGIDVAFARWRKKPALARTQMINTLGYCAQAIAAEAQALANATPTAGTEMKAPFSLDAVRNFVARNAGVLRGAGHDELAESLESLDLNTLCADLEQLERRLTAIEQKMIARLRANASEADLNDARNALDRDLKPYRGKMTSDQLAMLEKQFLERRLLESAGLPRLSLFYL